MTISDLLINFIFSFAVTAGFSIFFNAPKKSLIPCGIVGGIGWCARFGKNIGYQNAGFID